MQLVRLKCPDCGSVLETDANAKPVLFCQYCGSKLLIDDGAGKTYPDDPAKAGYEFEQGRIKAQREERQRERKKEENIAEAKRVMQENYKKQHAVAERSRNSRNAKYTLHGWLLFLAILGVLFAVPGNAFVKVLVGLISGCIIWAVQSAKSNEPYVHQYTEHVDTDEEGNITHVDRL